MSALRATLASTCLALCALAVAAPVTAAAPKRFFGVVTQSQVTAAEVEMMRDAGVGTFRAQLGWPTVQSQEGDCQADSPVGTCDWRAYDALVGTLAANGIELFPYLLNVPSFVASDPNTPPVRSKRARKAWTDFVEAAVRRYGSGGAYWETVFPLEHPGAEPMPIRSWQIWNEPSAQPFWKPRPRTREYAKLVKLTSKAITGVDRDAYVVLAGLFGTPTVGINQQKFLRGLYKVPGIERFFDAVAIHPYGPDLARVKVQVDWALDEIRRARDRKADLWISEIGWASDRLHNQLGVGRRGQARMLRKSFRLFERKRRQWDLRAVNWYAWQDVDGEGFCDFCRRSGLINLDKEPKPAYDAFRAAAR